MESLIEFWQDIKMESTLVISKKRIKFHWYKNKAQKEKGKIMKGKEKSSREEKG